MPGLALLSCLRGIKHPPSPISLFGLIIELSSPEIPEIGMRGESGRWVIAEVGLDLVSHPFLVGVCGEVDDLALVLDPAMLEVHILDVVGAENAAFVMPGPIRQFGAACDPRDFEG